MTLAEIKSSVRGLLDDTEFDGDRIREAANWFVYELFNNTRTRLMEESDTISASAGDTTADFPDDLMTRINIYTTVPSVYEMNNNYVEYGDFMKGHANFASATSALARIWTDFGNKMRFAQPLSVAHTFQIDYLREPVAMVADSDECEVPDRYSELVSKGTLVRVMEMNEDYLEAAQERSNLEPLVTAFIRNEARGGGKTGPTIIRTNRGRRYSDHSVRRMGE